MNGLLLGLVCCGGPHSLVLTIDVSKGMDGLVSTCMSPVFRDRWTLERSIICSWDDLNTFL